MKTLNTTTRRFFAVMFMGLALALTACGGGDSGGNSVNSTDGVVTQAEADSVTKGMTQAQVAAIFGSPSITTFAPESLIYPGEALNGHPTVWVVHYGADGGAAHSIAHTYADGDKNIITNKLL